MKSNLLIIFPDEWLAYAPTVLNTANSISDSFNVKIIAIDIGTFKGNSEIENVEFIKISLPLMRLLSKLRLYRPFKALALYLKARRLVKKEGIDTIIGVDSMGWFVGQRLHVNTHFLSLEIKRDIYFTLCNKNHIKSVAIQNVERLDYIFSRRPENIFFLQNAPPFQPYKRYVGKESKGRLIFFGHALPEHGIYSCLEAMYELKDEMYQLTIKGLVPERVKDDIEKRYAGLIKANKLIIDTSYIKQSDIVNYLTGFSIGFCLYNLELIPKNNVDYLISAPSGKLFNYYAAGVPIIGSDTAGLTSVREFDAGILLTNLSADQIKRAIVKISENLNYHKDRCIEAAKHFDFDKAILPYKKFLMELHKVPVSM